jgi:hypothetical protein
MMRKKLFVIYGAIFLFSFIIGYGLFSRFILGNKLERSFIGSQEENGIEMQKEKHLKEDKEGKSSELAEYLEQKGKIDDTVQDTATAVSGNGLLKLETAATNMQVGQTYQVQVYGNGTNAVVDGVEFKLNYSPELLQIENFQLGSFFPTYLKKEIDRQHGEISIIAVQDTDKRMAKELIVSFSVTPKSAGSTEIEFVEKTAQMAADGGKNILAKTTGLKLVLSN